MGKFGEELVESAAEALTIAKGATTAARTVTPEMIDVAALRHRLGLSQAEQQRRFPDQAARVLLTIIAREPEAAQRALTE